MRLYNLYQLLQQTVNSTYKDIECGDITCDSRLVKAGDIFVAISGNQEDGNKYIASALQKQAAVIITEKDYYGENINAAAIIKVAEARWSLSLISAHLYNNFPDNIILVTGTNGKTSVVHFCREIWRLLSIKAASMGTLGKIFGSKDDEILAANLTSETHKITTSDAPTLYRDLNILRQANINHIAIEASSHGLTQERLTHLPIKAAAFTSFSQDHLDYHHSMPAYLTAKLKLFNEILPPNHTAVIYNNIGNPISGNVTADIIALCQSKQHNIILYGEENLNIDIANIANLKQLTLSNYKQNTDHIELQINYDGKQYPSHAYLFGKPQAYNLLCAMALVMAAQPNLSIEDIIAILPQIAYVPGRMELVTMPNKPRVFVDYSHKPEALAKAIASIKDYSSNNLTIVFGCGGERDVSKRKDMAEIAALAQQVIITDDNPRHEDARAIRRQLLIHCPKAYEQGDRHHAISMAINNAHKDDIILVAGRGGEKYQIIGDKMIAFDDVEVVKDILNKPLYNSKEIAAICSGQTTIDMDITGIDFNSNTVKAAELFVALKGLSSDGHNYLEAVRQKNAIALVSDIEVAKASGCNYIAVNDTYQALCDLARYRRQNSQAVFIGVTGSVGKTTTKSAIYHILQRCALAYSSVGGYNNHVGLPVSLAAMPALANFGIFELGMNHSNEIAPLSQILEPNIILINNVEPAHIGNFTCEDEIAYAKAEIFVGAKPGSIVILNKDNKYFSLLAQLAAANNNIREIVSFGSHLDSDMRLVNYEFTGSNSSHVTVDIMGEMVEYDLPFIGRHLIANSLAAITVAVKAGITPHLAAKYLADFNLVNGRGKSYLTKINGHDVDIIDESYNANPSAVQEVLTAFAKRQVKGRKIIVLGDMRELGDKAIKYHQDLKDHVYGFDAIFTYGELSKHLYQELDAELIDKFHHDKLENLQEAIVEYLRQDDTILFKASKTVFWIYDFVKNLVEKYKP